MCQASISAIIMLADIVECHMFSCYEIYTNKFELVNLYTSLYMHLLFGQYFSVQLMRALLQVHVLHPSMLSKRERCLYTIPLYVHSEEQYITLMIVIPIKMIA